MERVRLAGLVGLAFLVGLILGGSLTSLAVDAPHFARPTDAPLVVRLQNLGPRDADASLALSRASGGGVAQWSGALPAGGTLSRELQDLPREELVLSVHVSWAAVGRSASGDHARTIEPRPCGGRTTELLVPVDTTNGIAFQPAQMRCL